MNVTLKIDDELCRQARHRAVDANMSLSAWVAELLKNAVQEADTSNQTMVDLIGDDDGRGFEEFLPDRKADLDRPIEFP
ncbi:MAG: hypothetical protein GVY36_05835 [Verrucomicrobia bacterium]|jgi:hypothetical protein|nr:hypothetical protein [Verrucomicrobiota bacterium]